MQIFIDVIEFIKTLSLVDIAFFFAVVVLMLLIITLIYFIKENNEEDIEIKDIVVNPNISPVAEENDAIIDLKEITKALENAEAPAINLNSYEEEQEEKAIISYEELLKRKNDFAINYSEEESIDEDLSIKKVDLGNLVNKDVSQKSDIKVMVISYEKEEAFLEALKTLQQKLN